MPIAKLGENLTGITITKLHRDPEEGFWRARVSLNGETVDVHLKYGSWMCEVRKAPRSQEYQLKDVMPPIAAALCAKIRPLEKRERKEAEGETTEEQTDDQD